MLQTVNYLYLDLIFVIVNVLGISLIQVIVQGNVLSARGYGADPAEYSLCGGSHRQVRQYFPILT